MRSLPTKHLSGFSQWKSDLLVCIVVALMACGIGSGTNAFRRNPLPWRYLSPAERLQAQLTELPAASVPRKEAAYVSVEELKAGWLLLDARPEVFYEAGHIPDALLLDRENFRSHYERLRPLLEKDKAQLLVIYCHSLECEDSALVADALSKLGYTNLRILLGGWEAWQERKQP